MGPGVAIGAIWLAIDGLREDARIRTEDTVTMSNDTPQNRRHPMATLIVPDAKAELLQRLIRIARDLTEPTEPNYEYIRGQANLIADACGMGGDRQDSSEVCEILCDVIAGKSVNIVGETYYPDF